MLDHIHETRIFTKLPLCGAYNLIRINQGDEYNTAFRTGRDQFEYDVLPFRLTNTPAMFQSLSMIAYGHTLTTSLYDNWTAYSSIQQPRRSIRSMYTKCCSDSGHSAHKAKPRNVNSEFRKSASRGLFSLLMESAWNGTRSPQSRTG